MINNNPSGVLLVGSIPFKSSKEVFTKVCDALPGRLHTIPDGETGERSVFIMWQLSRFPPLALREDFGGTPYPEAEKPTFTLDDIGKTGYDDQAISSYAEFVNLREQGVIPSNVRFQVSFPTAVSSIMWFCKPELKLDIEPLYERRLQESLDRMVATIPHHDLVIQFDLAPEVVSLEGERGRQLPEGLMPYFPSAQAGLVERVARLCQHIPSTVNIAFHFCYGDVDHKHLIEPVDTGVIVDLANDILETLGKTHTIEWIHMPVPRARTDPAYFDPLRSLRLNNTRLYLGLVIEHDEEGTAKRIATAKEVCPYPFGVATECGMGRTPTESIDSILTISKNVTAPIQVQTS